MDHLSPLPMKAELICFLIVDRRRSSGVLSGRGASNLRCPHRCTFGRFTHHPPRNYSQQEIPLRPVSAVCSFIVTAANLRRDPTWALSRMSNPSATFFPSASSPDSIPAVAFDEAGEDAASCHLFVGSDEVATLENET